MWDGVLPPQTHALVVLARYPRAGEVKTRLAAAIGAAPTARLYRAFLEDLRRRFADRRTWELCWGFDPPDSPFAEEIAAPAPAFPQAAGDLGDRMQAALATVFAAGARLAVLIGSDVPHLPLRTVEQAFESLSAGAEVVLAPAEDGGYALIGMRSLRPALFSRVRWGTDSVLRDTIRAAREAGVEPALLPVTYDVDELGGLERLYGDILAGRLPELTATRAALEGTPRLRYKRRNAIRRRTREPR